MENSSLLSLLIWIPILGGVGVLLGGDHRPVLARFLALLVSSVTFGLSISLYVRFDSGSAAMQLQE